MRLNPLGATEVLAMFINQRSRNSHTVIGDKYRPCLSINAAVILNQCDLKQKTKQVFKGDCRMLSKN